MSFVTGIFFLGHQVMSSPFFSTVRHQGLSLSVWVIHYFPGDIHVLFRPHLPVLFYRLHGTVKKNFRTLGRFQTNILVLIVSTLFFGLFSGI